MTLEMVIGWLYLSTGNEKSDTNYVNPYEKKSACLLSLGLMKVANITEIYGIVTPVE